MSRVREIGASCKARIDELTQIVVSEWDRLEALRQEIDVQFPRRVLEIPGKVKLDVGGKVFYTTLAALTSRPGFFRVLFGGYVNLSMDADGSIFIDRSPLVFHIILSHLSNYPIRLQDLTKSEVDLLILDAHYYELEDLQRALGMAVPLPGPSAGLEQTLQEWRDGIAEGESFEEYVARVKAGMVEKRAQMQMQREQLERLLAKTQECVGCSDKIKLQLQDGSRVYSTTVRTLCKQDGPLRRKFMRPELWRQDVDPKEGTVFVDCNSQTFDWVLNLLRGYPEPVNLPEPIRVLLQHDLDYFGGLTWERGVQPAYLRRTVKDVNSIILESFGPEPGLAFIRLLQSWLGVSSTIGDLLYRSSRDGATARDFHRCCDKAAQTVVLCKSGKSVFGGFCSVPWVTEDGVESYVEAEDTWLFTLSNSHDVPPTRFRCLKPEYAVFCSPEFGPAFGLGRDLVFWYYSTPNCYHNFPQSYEDTTGKGCALFTGSRLFTFDELEVFSVI